MKKMLPLLSALWLLASCQQRVLFVTQSSIGLDVSGTANYPNKVSFSYNRYEGAIVPRKTGAATNESHSIFGGMDADVGFGIPPKYDIKQVFATGRAAMLATQRDHDSEAAIPDEPVFSSNDKKPLVFFTSTTFGLHLTLGEQEMAPNALLGYRRSEAAVIPVPVSSNEVRSVYADIRISNSERAVGGTNSSVVAGLESATNAPDLKASAIGKLIRGDGVHIKQSFATGRAAEILARTPAAKIKLNEAAGLEGEVTRLVAKMQTELDTVLQFVDDHGKVSAARLVQLLTDDAGHFLTDTEDWPQQFGNQPVERLRNELVGLSHGLVPQLASKAKKLSDHP